MQENKCYSKIEQIKAGELIKYADPALLPPAEAPFPSLVESDVTEPPLPEVRSQPPSLPEVTSQPPTSKQPKAEAKAIQGSFAVVITIAVLVSFFISV